MENIQHTIALLAVEELKESSSRKNPNDRRVSIYISTFPTNVVAVSRDTARILLYAYTW